MQTPIYTPSSWCQCEYTMNLDLLCLSILSLSQILEETKHMYLLTRNQPSCHLALQWYGYICPANHIIQQEPMSVPSAMSLSHPNLKMHMLFTVIITRAFIVNVFTGHDLLHIGRRRGAESHGAKNAFERFSYDGLSSLYMG